VKPRLVLFDLDHTLLLGDSDTLWCDFLVEQGVLDRQAFAARNADMEARYRAGTVGADEFAGFYVSTLAGRSPAQWQPLRQRFLDEQVIPRIPPGALALVRQELAAATLVAMTTATNRFLTELTAAHFGIAHLLATETQLHEGRFTGRVEGAPNMRQGKVSRLQAWLQDRGEPLARWHSVAYSDSSNDLPLLEAVDEPIVVEPDPRLDAVAQARGWASIRWPHAPSG
jgi:HAD superfamily hydrolase (TIGR01490 family)